MEEEPDQPPRVPASPPQPVEPEQLWVDAEWWRGMLGPSTSPAVGSQVGDPSGGAPAVPAADDAPGELPLAQPDDAWRTSAPRPPAEPVDPTADPVAAPPTQPAVAVPAEAPAGPRPEEHLDPSPAAPAAPAVPQRHDVHVPRVRRRPETVPPARATSSPGAVRPPRRGVREVLGPRVADAGLLLLALVVVLLVVLALAG